MEPAEVAVTEREAEVMGLEGVGWGLVLEEPPPESQRKKTQWMTAAWQERGSSEGKRALNGLPTREGEQAYCGKAMRNSFFLHSLSCAGRGFYVCFQGEGRVCRWRGSRFWRDSSSTLVLYLFLVDAGK